MKININFDSDNNELFAQDNPLRINCNHANHLVYQFIKKRDKDSLKKALFIYSEIIEANPFLPDAYIGLALICLIINKKEEAFKVLNSALVIFPANRKITDFYQDIQKYTVPKKKKLREYLKFKSENK